jgi:hypothetical protein
LGEETVPANGTVMFYWRLFSNVQNKLLIGDKEIKAA